MKINFLYIGIILLTSWYSYPMEVAFSLPQQVAPLSILCNNTIEQAYVANQLQNSERTLVEKYLTLTSQSGFPQSFRIQSLSILCLKICNKLLKSNNYSLENLNKTSKIGVNYNRYLQIWDSVLLKQQMEVEFPEHYLIKSPYKILLYTTNKEFCTALLKHLINDYNLQDLILKSRSKKDTLASIFKDLDDTVTISQVHKENLLAKYIIRSNGKYLIEHWTNTKYFRNQVKEFIAKEMKQEGFEDITHYYTQRIYQIFLVQVNQQIEYNNLLPAVREAIDQSAKKAVAWHKAFIHHRLSGKLFSMLIEDVFKDCSAETQKQVENYSSLYEYVKGRILTLEAQQLSK